MANVESAVSIITDGGGAPAGFTATAVCSATDDPPTLLICLNRGASVYGAFEVKTNLCVIALSSGQEQIAAIFGENSPQSPAFSLRRVNNVEDWCPRIDRLCGGIRLPDTELYRGQPPGRRFLMGLKGENR
jgi:flavin reductase